MLKEIASSGDELIDAFGGLYTSFEEAAMNEGALQDAGFEGDWLQPFIEIAVENIIPPFVEIRGTLTLSINSTTGVDTIRDALLAAEAFSLTGRRRSKSRAITTVHPNTELN